MTEAVVAPWPRRGPLRFLPNHQPGDDYAPQGILLTGFAAGFGQTPVLRSEGSAGLHDGFERPAHGGFAQPDLRGSADDRPDTFVRTEKLPMF